MQVHNTTFQIKTVFNNVLFSAEVHNPLHAHLLARSHICIKMMNNWIKRKTHINDLQVKRPRAGSAVQSTQVSWDKGGLNLDTVKGRGSPADTGLVTSV